MDLADQNEEILVKQVKDKANVIVPFNYADRPSVNNELIHTLQETEAKYRKHRTTQIKNSIYLWDDILQRLKARKEVQMHLKSGDRSEIRKIEQIILELPTTPFE